MESARHKALQVVNRRTYAKTPFSSRKISEFFGKHALGVSQMRALLPVEAFSKLLLAIKKNKPIDMQTADSIASAVRSWAMEKGVTHYTHWFHPLTGSTAEKHDTFYDSSRGIEVFRGSELVQQEPDASSFPSGGIRSTFEARGYTAWDPSSPFFIWDATLCIPTVFLSYTKDTLDYKAPLLKSIQALNEAATRVCRWLDKRVERVVPMVGCELEYFVVDRALYNARPDLIMSGHTLFGAAPARGQQLEDHYFGSIPPRIMAFMKDFEKEAHRLGIPLRTRHNEVAPAQFELAPLFEVANVAVDHDQLLRDVMEKVAIQHNLRVLFHEKPFKGLNGNGKHCNWSLCTDKGLNLLQPSQNPKENLIFLTFFLSTLRAVFEHVDLLRASVASYGNEWRMGQLEAPPPILSVFIGEALHNVLSDLIQTRNVRPKKGTNVHTHLGIHQIPSLTFHNTDRNRTSPFAFTGNKFEFRAVGAEANMARPLTILNLMVADRLRRLHEELETQTKKQKEKSWVLAEILRRYAEESAPIVFNGNGYSKEWVEEAKKRGLSAVADTPPAMDAYLSPSSLSLFEQNHVLTRREVKARHHILLENYVKKVDIDARLMEDIILSHIIPAVVSYQNTLLRSIEGLDALGMEKKALLGLMKRLSKGVTFLSTELAYMADKRERIHQMEDIRARAFACCDELKKRYFLKLRAVVDELETLVDDKIWPLVKYRELLYLR